MKKLPECYGCGAWLVPPRETLCPRCEEKANNYANAKIKADQIRGYPESRIQDERSPDGRSIYAEMEGKMKNYRDGRSEE